MTSTPDTISVKTRTDPDISGVIINNIQYISNVTGFYLNIMTVT